jgi:hypothetical protein
LNDGGVDFIVVGGLAALLNGASLVTFDVEIVHARDPENLVRLERALNSIGASTERKRSGG